MDYVTKSFQNINIKWDISTIRLCSSSIHFQKCYIPYDVVKQHSLQVGSFVILEFGKKFYICKVCCKQYSSVIQADLCVEILYNVDSSAENDFQFHITRIAKPFTTVKLEVFVSSPEAKIKWGDNKNILCRILKKYILNLFYFSSNCKIQLINFASASKLGLCSVLIKETDSGPKDVATVSSKTRIVISNIFPNNQSLGDRNRSIIVGYEDLKKKIVEVVECNYLYYKNRIHSVFPPVKQILLTGPSGCGKSSLVRIIGEEMKCPIITISGHNITNSTPGETEKTLRNVFSQAFNCGLSEGKCIINLEDIDILCPKSALGTSYSKRISSQLLQLLDKVSSAVGVVVIATSNKSENIDSSALHHGRLELELNVGPPNERQRGLILQHFMKLFNFYDDVDFMEIISQEIAKVTQGYVGVDLKYVCQRVSEMKAKSTNHLKNVTISDCEKLFKNALTTTMPSSLRSETANVIFNIKTPDNIGGLDDVKKQIDMVIWWPLVHKKSFMRMGISRPRGVLLHGPPGCAKTSLVRNFACLRRLPMLAITPAELYSPYVGEAEKVLAKMFQQARQNAPCLIFLDEIDSLIGGRDVGKNACSSSEIQSRVLATLLMEMDGIGCSPSKSYISDDFVSGDDGVIVIAATNKPKNIDAALLRPGRFDKHIKVPMPDVNARFDILKLLTRNVQLAGDVDLLAIAAKTEGFSGADVKNLYNETVLYAMKQCGVHVQQISFIHFEEALQIVKQSLVNEIKTDK